MGLFSSSDFKFQGELKYNPNNPSSLNSLIREGYYLLIDEATNKDLGSVITLKFPNEDSPYRIIQDVKYLEKGYLKNKIRVFNGSWLDWNPDEDTPVDNLITSDSTKPLSALQGVVLKALFESFRSGLDLVNQDLTTFKADVEQAHLGMLLDVSNNRLQIATDLTDGSEDKALSALNGLVLNNKIDNLKTTVIEDSLVSDSEVNALSARKGKELNEHKVSKFKLTQPRPDETIGEVGDIAIGSDNDVFIKTTLGWTKMKKDV